MGTSADQEVGTAVMARFSDLAGSDGKTRVVLESGKKATATDNSDENFVICMCEEN